MIRLALCLLLLPVLLYAQPDTLWTRTVDSPGYSWIHALCQTPDGGYVAVGEGLPPSMWNFDARLVKVNAAGEVLWDRLIDHGIDEHARDVLPAPDGGLMVAGSVSYTDEDAHQMFLMKTAATGDSQWFRTYDVHDMGESWEVAMAAVPGGGYVLTGTTTGVGSDLQLLLIRVAANGDSLWTRQHGDPWLLERGVDVVALDDGFVIFGQRFGVNNTYWTYWLIRTDLQGDTLWTRSWARETTNWMTFEYGSLLRMADGGYLIGGTVNVYQPHEDNTDIWLTRTDAQGNTLWTSRFGGPGVQVFGDFTALPDGNCVVAGGDESNWLLAKVDSAGSVVWSESVDMGSHSYPNQLTCLLPLGGGGFLAAGHYLYDSVGYTQPLFVRTAPDSVLAAERKPRLDVPADFTLHECYPNPFNAATRIAFDLPAASTVMLNVFDVTGRNVGTVAHGTFAAGPHTLLFDANGLASGVYFYQLRAGSFRDTRKMLLLR